MEVHRKVTENHGNCIHKKNICTLYDLNPSDLQYQNLNDHLKNCKVCQREFARYSELNMAAQIYIPKPTMDKEFKETFDRELHDLLKNFGINDKIHRKNAAIKKLSSFNNFGELLLKSFFSRAMIFSFGFAGIIFLIMKRHF